MYSGAPPTVCQPTYKHEIILKRPTYYSFNLFLGLGKKIMKRHEFPFISELVHSLWVIPSSLSC